MEVRFKLQPAKVFLTADYYQSFEINEVKVSFIPAGHMLGSAQVLMEYKGIRYLYTGDFKLQADCTCEPFHFIEADVLITETTFADPVFSHPDDVEEIKKLNELNGKNILLGAYPLGKAQRLISLMDQHCPGKKIVVHNWIAAFNKVYEKFDCLNADWTDATGDMLRKETNLVYIVPPSVFKRYNTNRKFYLVFASGWDNLQRNCDIKLKISDHADWKDLLLLISKTGAKKILTTHGDGRILKNYFRDKGIDVAEL